FGKPVFKICIQRNVYRSGQFGQMGQHCRQGLGAVRKAVGMRVTGTGGRYCLEAHVFQASRRAHIPWSAPQKTARRTQPRKLLSTFSSAVRLGQATSFKKKLFTYAEAVYCGLFHPFVKPMIRPYSPPFFCLRKADA